jgi:hypothetical protein
MLGVLPLPGKPEITEGSFAAFRRMAGVIAAHRPRVRQRSPYAAAKAGAGRAGAKAGVALPRVEIVLHKELGPHEVTVVVPESAEGFGRWVQRFAAERDLEVDEQQLPRWDALARSYLARRFRFFALHLVRVGPEERSVTPLRYRFRTPFLYFPLRASSAFEGHTVANLFLVTRRKPDVWGTGTGLYAGFFGPHTLEQVPVKLRVTHRELRAIDPVLAASAPTGGAWLTAAHYAGRNAGLRSDLMLGRGALVARGGF